MALRQTATLIIAGLLVAACGDTDLERGVTGAAIGGVGAQVMGADPVTGALVGGAAGVICDDVTPDLCN